MGAQVDRSHQTRNQGRLNLNAVDDVIGAVDTFFRRATAVFSDTAENETVCAPYLWRC